MDKLGKANLMVHFLSTLSIQSIDELVDNSFPDEHLFSLNMHTPWFADILNYLVRRKIPTHFSPREKRQLVHKCFPYS